MRLNRWAHRSESSDGTQCVQHTLDWFDQLTYNRLVKAFTSLELLTAANCLAAFDCHLVMAISSVDLSLTWVWLRFGFALHRSFFGAIFIAPFSLLFLSIHKKKWWLRWRPLAQVCWTSATGTIVWSACSSVSKTFFFIQNLLPSSLTLKPIQSSIAAFAQPFRFKRDEKVGTRWKRNEKK